MHVAGVTHKFQSTLPAWGETVWMRYVRPWLEFQSTLPAWGETQARDRCQAWDAISIHSPRMGRDETISSISPSGWDFNPLSPHGERPDMASVAATAAISIHSPRMGRDAALRRYSLHAVTFQSTLPAWGETDELKAAQEELKDFNPLSPHGERPTQACDTRNTIQFQSTLPAWGETTAILKPHAVTPFQSTLPAWGETGAAPDLLAAVIISIHSPRMGRDDD